MLKVYIIVSLLFMAHLTQARILTTFKAGTQTYNVEQLATGTELVSGMQFIDKKTLVFAERRKGRISTLNLTSGEIKPIELKLDAYTGGQGGLNDIALHPNFAKNKLIYLSYSKNFDSRQTTVLALGELKSQKIINFKEIFKALPLTSRSGHFGSQIAFDHKGFLFASIGDHMYRSHAQKLDNHLEKIIRLNLDGSVPKDNPFVKQKKARPEIWTYGHRNQQGLFFDQTTKKLYSNEHGPQGGDEINEIVKGKNYGWPLVTYGKEYGSGQVIGKEKLAGFKDPLKYYVPSIAPSSLIVYQSNQLPAFKGKFISSALAGQQLNAVSISRPKFKEHRFLQNLNERFRSLQIGPDQLIYVGTDHKGILRISKKPNTKK